MALVNALRAASAPTRTTRAFCVPRVITAPPEVISSLSGVPKAPSTCTLDSQIAQPVLSARSVLWRPCSSLNYARLATFAMTSGW